MLLTAVFGFGFVSAGDSTAVLAQSCLKDECPSLGMMRVSHVDYARILREEGARSFEWFLHGTLVRNVTVFQCRMYADVTLRISTMKDAKAIG